MSKRKFDTESTPPSITEAQLKAFDDFIGCLPSDTLASTLLERMQETLQQVYCPATKYKDVMNVVHLFEISFKRDASHALRLKDSELQNTKTLNEHIAFTLRALLNCDYYQDRMLEGRTRTILELIFLDRFEKLSAPSSLLTRIRGFADWALNYTVDKGDSLSESTLIITEAKRIGDAPAGLPQLLIYMVGIHQRQKQKRINRGVFGILADSSSFIFAFLAHDRNFYVSESLEWLYHESKILAYIDTILLDAIESSPHTTPTKKENAVLYNYEKYLGQRWVFGEKAVKKENVAEEADEQEIVAEKTIEKVVDVDERGMVVEPETQ